MRRSFMLVCALMFVIASAEATTWQITVQNYEFVPAVLTIESGDTVVWTNVQGTHNVLHACSPVFFGNAIANAPWSYEFVFDVPAGEYPYLCEVHPNNMIGVISVQGVPQQHNVTVQNFSFTPQHIVVQSGDAVVWTNISGFHNVHHVGNPSLFGNGIASAPWTYSFVFDLPAGVYSYVCEAHAPGMSGTVTVEGGGGDPPAAPADVTVQVAGDLATLRWTPVAGAGCYTVWVSQDGSESEFTNLLGITGEPLFVQPVTGLTGSRYFFQVRAIGG